MRRSTATRALLVAFACTPLGCAGDISERGPGPARESGMHQSDCGDGDDRACAYADYDPRHPTLRVAPDDEEVDTEPWMPDLQADAGTD